MEMESGSVPRNVLLSKGSKMSSLMLVGCRTYPHWPLDMNKAWFICMGLSRKHRQEIQEMRDTLCTSWIITPITDASQEALGKRTCLTPWQC